MPIVEYDGTFMPKQKTTPSSFSKTTCWAAFLAGITIGVLSQRIPESKSFTDDLIRDASKNELVREWFSKIQPYVGNFSFSIPSDHNIVYNDYLEEQPHPAQPISSFIIHRQGYSVGYDARMRNPSWVYEHLTADSIKGDVDRSQYTFKEDEKIPQHLRATIASYKGQGLDQGHMAPAADHRSDPELMNDTFYLTNVCPQCPQFNREYWLKLEKHVRDLTKDYKNIYVITGPLYLPHQEGKRRFVKYQVIGQDNVAVPSHFFKVITLEDRHGNREVQAYVMPNTVIPVTTPLEKFRTTADKVEKAAGIILFNQPVSD